jgi:hypothetical protein
VLLAAVLSAPLAAQDGEDAPEDDATSMARPCLNHPTIRRTRILNDRNIVFYTRGGTIYNNHLPRECPSLKPRMLVNYGITNGRVCAGDSFQVLWETRPGAYVPAFLCPLGYFVPITKAELEDLTAATEESRERRPRGRSSREAGTIEQVELPPDEGTTAPNEPAADRAGSP